MFRRASLLWKAAAKVKQPPAVIVPIPTLPAVNVDAPTVKAKVTKKSAVVVAVPPPPPPKPANRSSVPPPAVPAPATAKKVITAKRTKKSAIPMPTVPLPPKPAKKSSVPPPAVPASATAKKVITAKRTKKSAIPMPTVPLPSKSATKSTAAAAAVTPAVTLASSPKKKAQAPKVTKKDLAKYVALAAADLTTPPVPTAVTKSTAAAPAVTPAVTLASSPKKSKKKAQAPKVTKLATTATNLTTPPVPTAVTKSIAAAPAVTPAVTLASSPKKTKKKAQAPKVTKLATTATDLATPPVPTADVTSFLSSDVSEYAKPPRVATGTVATAKRLQQNSEMWSIAIKLDEPMPGWGLIGDSVVLGVVSQEMQLKQKVRCIVTLNPLATSMDTRLAFATQIMPI